MDDSQVMSDCDLSLIPRLDLLGAFTAGRPLSLMRRLATSWTLKCEILTSCGWLAACGQLGIAEDQGKADARDLGKD